MNLPTSGKKILQAPTVVSSITQAWLTAGRWIVELFIRCFAVLSDTELHEFRQKADEDTFCHNIRQGGNVLPGILPVRLSVNNFT